MTEEDAKTKWCPFARLVTTENGSAGMRMGAPAGHNRYSGKPGELCTASLCIASACMAWREKRETRAFDGVGKEIPTTEVTHYAGGELRHVVVGGYCGLAGPRP